MSGEVTQLVARIREQGSRLRRLLAALDDPNADAALVHHAWRECSADDDLITDLCAASALDPARRAEVAGEVEQLSRLHAVVRSQVATNRDATGTAISKSRTARRSLGYYARETEGGESCDLAG